MIPISAEASLVINGAQVAHRLYAIETCFNGGLRWINLKGLWSEEDDAFWKQLLGIDGTTYEYRPNGSELGPALSGTSKVQRYRERIHYERRKAFAVRIIVDKDKP